MLTDLSLDQLTVKYSIFSVERLLSCNISLLYSNSAYGWELNFPKDELWEVVFLYLSLEEGIERRQVTSDAWYSGAEVEAVAIRSLSVELLAVCSCDLLLVEISLLACSSLSKRGLSLPRLLLTMLWKSCRLGMVICGRRLDKGFGKAEDSAAADFVLSCCLIWVEVAWPDVLEDSPCSSSSSSSASMYLKRT